MMQDVHGGKDVNGENVGKYWLFQHLMEKF